MVALLHACKKCGAGWLLQTLLKWMKQFSQVCGRGRWLVALIETLAGKSKRLSVGWGNGCRLKLIT